MRSSKLSTPGESFMESPDFSNSRSRSVLKKMVTAVITAAAKRTPMIILKRFARLLWIDGRLKGFMLQDDEPTPFERFLRDRCFWGETSGSLSIAGIVLSEASSGAVSSPSPGSRSMRRQEGQTMPSPSWSRGTLNTNRHSGQTKALQRLGVSVIVSVSSTARSIYAYPLARKHQLRFFDKQPSLPASEAPSSRQIHARGHSYIGKRSTLFQQIAIDSGNSRLFQKSEDHFPLQ